MNEKLINQTELAKLLNVSIAAIGRYKAPFHFYLGTFSQTKGKIILFNELEVEAISYVKQKKDEGARIIDAAKDAIKKFYNIDVQDVCCENCAMLESEIAYRDEVIRQQHALLSTLTARSIK